MKAQGKKLYELMHIYVGRKALMRANTGDRWTIRIPVLVVNARVNYGRLDLLVRPFRGDGSQWVSEEKVEVVDDWPEDDEDASAESTKAAGDDESADDEFAPGLPPE